MPGRTCLRFRCRGEIAWSHPRQKARLTTHALGVVCLSFVFALTAYGQNPPELRPVSVELLVRLPDGHPLVQTAIVVKILGGNQFNRPVPEVNITTDNRGVARFEIPEGVYELKVSVHKIGHASVGATEFIAGTVARPEMPPLSGYGSVDIILPAGCGDNVTILAGYEHYSLPPNSSQLLHIDDLSAGRLSISASITSGPRSWLYDPCSDSATVDILPGQNLRVVLDPPSPRLTVPKRPDGKSQDTVRLGGRGDGTTVVWVHGTVRDDLGHPIPNATVYAVATYYGGIRMNGMTVEAATDGNGNYEVKGAGGLTSLSVTLVATAPGHPPAWAWPELTQNSSPGPPTKDLLLPSNGGKATITVVRDGKPVAGATVALYLENANLQDIWAMGGPNKAVEDVAYPTATTDAQGRATIDGLLPGRYRVLATTEGIDSIRHSAYGLERPGGLGPNAGVGGIPVQLGQTTTFKIKIYSQSNNASFRILRKDNKPYVGTGADQFGPIDTIGAFSSAPLDSSGLGHISLGHDGFWRLDFMFRDSPITYFPVHPPYFLSSGTLALSPNLYEADPPSFTARRIEPGSARIVVQDAEGNPVHATVDIMRSSSVTASGTTGDDGVVLFKGLYTGDQVGTLSDDYFAQIRDAKLPNSELVDSGKGDEPLPPPQLLHTRQAFMADKLWKERLPLVVNTETKLVVRADRLRFVTGVLHSSIPPPFGRPLDLWEDAGGFKYKATLRVLPGGEYVAGPFLSGHVDIAFWGSIGSHPVLIPMEMDANPDEPLHFDFDADLYTNAPQPVEKPSAPHNDSQLTAGGEAYLGVTGITSHSTGFKHLAGQVFLADGKTPALGALALYYVAGSSQPAFVAMADALGNLQPRGTWRGTYQGAFGPQESSPTAPILVSFLPGSSGATIQTSPVRPDEPVRLVLPPPTWLKGRVTIGGAAPSKRPGTVHVFAAYQGQGPLSSVLSVTTTADADGNFTLAGLTPGTYLIQASLDEIWLSQQEKVRVVAGNAKPIKLSIPLPGAPLHVKLVDSVGNPVMEKSITIDRTGPLAVLWPQRWTSDSLGAIYVPTLEAGRHRIRVSGSSTSLTINIPHLPAKPVEVRVRVDQSKD